MNTKIIPYFLSLLVFLNISAAPVISSSQALSNIQIKRATDGTTTVTIDGEDKHGFEFTTPNRWYPVLVPSTFEEIEKFKNIIKENGVPLDEERITNNLSVKERCPDLAVIDLNSEHYQIDRHIALFICHLEVPQSTPNWAIVAMLKSAEKSLGKTTKIDLKKIDNQTIDIMEFAYSPKEGDSLYGKSFFFIRNGKIFFFAGITNNNEWLPDVNNLMDSILTSFDFNIQN